MTSKPFKILGIQQIAIGGPDKNKLKALWVDVLGLTVKSTFVSARENVDEDICALGTPRRSTMSACGWTTCPKPSSG
jgi:lactoylglutathione lyase